MRSAQFKVPSDSRKVDLEARMHVAFGLTEFLSIRLRFLSTLPPSGQIHLVYSLKWLGNFCKITPKDLFRASWAIKVIVDLRAVDQYHP